MKVFSICILGFFFLPAFVYSSSIDREKVLNLGVVNGKVIDNNFVEVEKSLPDPVIFDYIANEGAESISYFIIKNVTLKSANEKEVNILQRNRVVSQSGIDSIVIMNYKIDFFVDGKSSRVIVRTQGDDVLIIPPKIYHDFSIRSNSPILLNVPRSYKGDISTLLEVEGWVDIP